MNLSDSTRKTNVQHFIDVYSNLKKESHENNDILFEKAVETLNQTREIKKEEWIDRKTRSAEKRVVSSNNNNETTTNIKDLFD